MNPLTPTKRWDEAFQIGHEPGLMKKLDVQPLERLIGRLVPNTTEKKIRQRN